MLSASDSLKSGNAYWVYSTQDGILDFSSGSSSKRNIDKTNGQVLPVVAVTMNITDKTGKKTTLYLSNNLNSDSAYRLPPMPPEGIFDVRFVSNKYVESLTGQIPELRLQSLEFPVRISFDLLQQMSIRISDASTNEIYGEVNNNEEIVVNNFTDKISLEVENTIPERSFVDSLFPNPFSERAQVSIAVANDTYVVVEMFDVLGKKVKTIYDGPVGSGLYQISVSSENISAGSYFIKAQIGDEVEVKKLVLVK